MAKSNQRLQMALPKGGDHVYIPIKSGLLKIGRGRLWLNPRPVNSQPIPSKSHHLRTIKILLIAVPEIDRSTRSRDFSRPLPSCPIILGLPFPIISSLVLIGTGGHSPKKLLPPPTGFHRFRTCSAISSCWSVFTSTGALSDSANRVRTTVSAALGCPILRADSFILWRRSGSDNKAPTLYPKVIISLHLIATPFSSS